MSVCVLYTAFDVVPAPKGASRHITAFTESLVRAGYDVTLFTAGLAGMPATEAYAGARIIRHLSEESNFLRRAHLFGDAVWEHLRERQDAYDVVHFRDIWSGAAALDVRGRFGGTYRTLYEANGLPSVELKYHYPALLDTELPQKLRAQEQAIVREVDAVACVSGVSAIFLQSLGALQQRVTVIHNGVDPDLFALGGQPAAPARRPRLVYSGTLTAWQGITTAIEAMPTVMAAFPEAELWLVGPAKRRHQKGLVKLADKLGLGEETVRFVDSVPAADMPDQLRAASVCLAPLTYCDRNVAQGCCPIKVIEYAAMARPIIAANLPVVRELVGEEEALFFEPGNAADLARQVIYVLSHPDEAAEMGARAAARTREELTWQRAGEKLLAVYDRLIERAPANTPRTVSPAPGSS